MGLTLSLPVDPRDSSCSILTHAVLRHFPTDSRPGTQLFDQR